jgi:ssDNA-binding Zn-finger/Zn-ribbon topoisomerase 1
MRGFIVAMEYLGAGLGAKVGGRRVPVCEHAYNLETATLARHPPRSGPRVGFPSCQRGWNSQPQAVRCPDCDTAVQRMARDLIATAIAAITGCLPPPGPDPS